MRSGFRTGPERADRWRREGGFELQGAQHGDIKPARELIWRHFPLLADLVQLPPLKKGERRKPYTINGVTVRPADRHRLAIELVREGERRKVVAKAAEDVIRIRRIWRENFGKTNCPKGAGPTAVEIAAERHAVEPAEIDLYFKG